MPSDWRGKACAAKIGEGIKPCPRADPKEMKLLVYGVTYLPTLQNETLALVGASSYKAVKSSHLTQSTSVTSSSSELHETEVEGEISTSLEL